MPRRQAAADPSLAIIGSNLRATRKDLNLQQQDAAAKAGVQREQLNRWEQGKAKPEITGLLKLAVAYGCSVDEFVAAVNPRYDQLITEEIPVNVKRHYEARVADLKRLALKAMDSLTIAEGISPTRGATDVRPETKIGKSKATRARRPKKK